MCIYSHVILSRICSQSKPASKVTTPSNIPPLRLLTEEEYAQQGEVETKKGLDLLRASLLATPNWPRHLAKLKNPKLMLDFLSGKTSNPNTIAAEEHPSDASDVFSDESDDDNDDRTTRNSIGGPATPQQVI